MNESIKKDPAFAPSYAWKGYVYHVNGNIDRATQLYNDFLAREHDTPLAAKVNFLLGKIYYDQHKWDKSEYHFKESQRIEKRTNLEHWIKLIEVMKAGGAAPSGTSSGTKETPGLK